MPSPALLSPSSSAACQIDAAAEETSTQSRHRAARTAAAHGENRGDRLRGMGSGPCWRGTSLAVLGPQTLEYRWWTSRGWTTARTQKAALRVRDAKGPWPRRFAFRSAGPAGQRRSRSRGDCPSGGVCTAASSRPGLS